MPACLRQSFIPPEPLIQLRRRFTAACSDLRLTVQTDTEGWLARVGDSEDGPALYSAYRCSLGAAKVAAVEFAVFRTVGTMEATSPEFVAQQMQWRESW